MNALQIKQALHAKGFTYSMLAEALDCKASLLSLVAHRKCVSRRAADAISKAIDQPIEKVFNDVPSYHLPALPTGRKRSEKEAELRQLLAS